MLFDFESYLTALDPAHVYSITKLPGGLVNETVRATEIDAPNVQSRESLFSGHSSLVLKYAPPFIAARGEGHPFSQARQTVEAAALALLSQAGGGPLQICEKTAVSVPKLLRYDEASRILILSDLGKVPNLTDVLNGCSDDSLSESTAKYIGERLGEFFARLHSLPMYHLIKKLCPESFIDHGIDSRELIYRMMVLPMEGYLRQFAYSDASELSRRAMVDFQQADDDAVRSFVLGDSWPGAILANLNRSGNPMVSVIDWEFAGFGRGVTGDVVQLLAHLHLHHFTAPGGSALRQTVELLADSIAFAYRAEAQRQDRTWTMDLRSGEAPNVATKALRSGILLMGREMVYYAIVKDWPCQCCKTKQRNNCPLRLEMVEKGVWYLRIAQSNDVDFCHEENLHSVLMHDYVLRSLFDGLSR